MLWTPECITMCIWAKGQPPKNSYINCNKKTKLTSKDPQRLTILSCLYTEWCVLSCLVYTQEWCLVWFIHRMVSHLLYTPNGVLSYLYTEMVSCLDLFIHTNDHVLFIHEWCDMSCLLYPRDDDYKTTKQAQTPQGLTVPVILSTTWWTASLTLVAVSIPNLSPKPIVFRNCGLLLFCKKNNNETHKPAGWLVGWLVS